MTAMPRPWNRNSIANHGYVTEATLLFLQVLYARLPAEDRDAIKALLLMRVEEELKTRNQYEHIEDRKLTVKMTVEFLLGE